MEKEKNRVTFYFVSGETMVVLYTDSHLEVLKDALRKEWLKTGIVGKEWGINFQTVTHYEVERLD